MKRKYWIALAVLALAVATLPLVQQASARGHKVDICHFDGHTADDGTVDFIITGQGDVCLEKGGMIINVACKGAVNGHGVSNSGAGCE